MKTRIHKNSLKAYASLKLEPVEREVLKAYAQQGEMADSLVTEIHNTRGLTMYKSNGASLQPRITYLLKKKMIKETRSVKSYKTGRMVRVCTITEKGKKALMK